MLFCRNPTAVYVFFCSPSIHPDNSHRVCCGTRRPAPVFDDHLLLDDPPFNPDILSFFPSPLPKSVFAGADCLRLFFLGSPFSPFGHDPGIGIPGFDMKATPKRCSGSDDSNLAGRKTSGRRAGFGRWNAWTRLVYLQQH